MPRRDAYVSGLRTVAPVLVGIVPFGLIAGAAAVEADLSLAQALGLSTIVFAGASQLAAIDLLGQDAPLLVVVGTALVINLRMVMYSASLAPSFTGVSRRARAVVAYLLTDQAYALSLAADHDDDAARLWYYLGLATPLWTVWVICTAIGAVVGARLPPWLPLSFAVPLTFLAILVPAVVDRPSLVAAVVGGTVAVLGVGLPYNLGLLAGAVAGIAAGMAVEVAR